MSRDALELVHHHPGRLRVRALVFETDPACVARVRERLDALPGVEKVEHTARTGSLLVAYQPGMIEPDRLIAAIAEAAALDLPREVPRSPRKPALVAVGVTREIDSIVAELTGGRADLRTLVPAGLAALSAFAWMRQKGERLPRWDNLLYWSYAMFTGLNHDVLDAAPPEQGDPTSAPAHDEDAS